MSTAARIEELRRKFDENPRRYFAPLANELRKAGDLTQAIALCREHLPRQPGHMSGYIVFGQALYESDALDEARSVFEQALALDPENLIALRHLGDIARGQGDPLAARRWYERVLDADPRNDDIATQLAALTTPAYPMRTIVTPGVAMPVVQQTPVAAMRPVSFTPSVPVPMIGMIVPTPDAALRAIDFDEVNARLRTPLVPSISQRTPAIPIPAVAMPAPDHDLLDLDAMEVAGDDVLRSVAPDAAGDHEDDADPFMFAGEARGNDGVVADVGEESVDVHAELDDLSFEEGLAAPDWPDTSALMARVVTPRSVTPAFVDVPVDAVEAFGREASDPVERTLPDPEPDIADEELVEELVVESSVVDAPGSDGSMETLGVDLVMEPPPEPTIETAIDPWTSISDNTVSDMHATIADAVRDLDFDAEAGADTDLPWLLPAATPTDDVEAVAEAIAADVPVAALPPAAEAEFGTAEEEQEEEVPSQAFVTETMGELLVTQGFIDQAISVYEELVHRRPYDPVLSSRLMELREQVPVPVPVPAPVSVQTPTAVATDVQRSTTAVFTARERFAALAARRVPRRTPRVSGAIAATDDGLASLFGNTINGAESATDDMAARALADAFLPQHIDSATGTDSFFGSPDLAAGTPARGTPAYGTFAEGSADESAPGAFSFDRFFPDPATQEVATNSNPDRSATPSPATEDLAQFSAWLKGLGNA